MWWTHENGSWPSGTFSGWIQNSGKVKGNFVNWNIFCQLINKHDNLKCHFKNLSLKNKELISKYIYQFLRLTNYWTQEMPVIESTKHLAI